MKKLVLYLTFCYPNEKRFFQILDILEKHKVDILEIGVPVENAHMDGAVIQDSHRQVLASGVDEAYFKETLKKIKENYSFEVALMTYKEGIEKFNLLSGNEDLYDGLLCVDEMITLKEFPSPIQLYNEDLSEAEMEERISNNRMFAYCMSGVGQTGSFEQVPTNYIETMARIRERSSLPIYIGFGIKEKEDVARVYENGADGAIIGSHFMKIINTSTLEEVEAYVQSLKSV
ncbi:tryptophan synthase subunit alpha [Bacillus chungangensis]|uniref:tryptophan synthase n=2 Tax=Bacillus chungangensis TaxID=587633 RepID=A0ABT9WWL3_9BACI|nr:tryptophan synthase subunit alpha [Bacillus chungangensis]MDQ0177272.1 tryptophan synthase alpha chain [Bacillus chungangensis]